LRNPHRLVGSPGMICRSGSGPVTNVDVEDRHTLMLEPRMAAAITLLLRKQRPPLDGSGC